MWREIQTREKEADDGGKQWSGDGDDGPPRSRRPIPGKVREPWGGRGRDQTLTTREACWEGAPRAGKVPRQTRGESVG